MPAPYITVDDVAARFERPVPPELDDWLAQRVADVHTRVAGRVPDLDDRIADGRTSLDMVQLVLSEIVLRLLRNPEGFAGEHEGDYGYYFPQGGAQAAGTVSITRDDLVELGVIARSPKARAIVSALPDHRIPRRGRL